MNKTYVFCAKIRPTFESRRRDRYQTNVISVLCNKKICWRKKNLDEDDSCIVESFRFLKENVSAWVRCEKTNTCKIRLSFLEIISNSTRKRVPFWSCSISKWSDWIFVSKIVLRQTNMRWYQPYIESTWSYRISDRKKRMSVSYNMRHISEIFAVFSGLMREPYELSKVIH